MQEDKENADWTDETDHEEEDREQLTTHRTPVGKLITHNLLRHIPTQEQTGDESKPSGISSCAVKLSQLVRKSLPKNPNPGTAP